MLDVPKDRASICRLPYEYTVGNVEDGEKQSTERQENSGAVTLDAGGVFWINAMGKDAGKEECTQECAGHCEGFQRPKKTVRAHASWRRK